PPEALREFEVLRARDRAGALDLLKTHRVDAVVAQMRLPDGSGLELVRELARAHPEPRRILLASYEDLPEIVRVRGLVSRVVKQWLWPVKPRDASVARKDRKHPVVQMLGGLSPRSEVYARHVAGVYAYLVLLPWQHEKRLTAVLGLLAEKARPDLWELLKEI